MHFVQVYDALFERPNGIDRSIFDEGATDRARNERALRTGTLRDW